MNKLALVVMLATCFGIGTALGTGKKIISPAGTKPGGNFSQGIKADNTLFISGQGGEDETEKIPSDFDAEVKQSLDNIGVVLKAAGTPSADVVSTQADLTDVAKFQGMNAVYTNYFKDPRPTRTTVVVAALVGGGNIEITATARK